MKLDLNKFIILVACLTSIFISCRWVDKQQPNVFQNSTVKVNGEYLNSVNIIQKDTTHFSILEFYSSSLYLNNKVEAVFSNLSLSERAAQLIMPATSEYYKIGIPFSEIKKRFLKRQIGGVLYLKGTKKKFIGWIEDLKKVSADSILPLINACDCEPTLYHKKFKDADSVTATNLMSTNLLVEKGAIKISNELKQMGIQLNFAPVADIGLNQDVINTRSFSTDPAILIERAKQFINSSQNLNIGTTIKHFPGHGAIMGDSHKGNVYIDGTLTEVNNFEKIIKEAKPVAVMVGHISIKNNKNYPSDTPASVSRRVIMGLLKNSLGFKGLVVTDAMQMKAVQNIPNASYKALIAGADLVVMPLNIETLHSQILNELRKNKSILKTQFESSIKKIIRLKICSGLIK